MPVLETLPGGTPVYTEPPHMVGTDALLLARFAEVKRGHTACDLGSGCGVLLLSLWDTGIAGGTGVELSASGAALLQQAIDEGGLTALTSVQGDIRDFKAEKPFDVVIANPPYFTSGQAACTNARATARHQYTTTLADFCAAAARIIKDRGRFYLCYPAGKLAGLAHTLCLHGFAPKRMQLVRKTAAHEPWLVLMDARKNGGEGLTILPDILLPPGEAVHF